MTETVQTPPTLDEAGLTGDVQSILDEAAATIKEPSERWKKQSSLVRRGDEQLPERVRVWRWQTGAEAWLATATIGKDMKKRHPDGNPVFVRAPEMVREGAYQEPIDQSCEVCAERTVHKKFYSILAYERHMKAFHPDEWDSIQRTEERKQRAEEQRLLRAALGAMDAKPKTAKAAAKCPVCNDFYVSKAHRAHKGEVDGNS